MVVAAEGSGVDLEVLNSFLLQRGIAKFKLPERLEIVPELPTTPTGKVRKSELRRLVSEALP